MQVQGKLIEIFDTQVVKETFRKREFVIEVAENPQYPEQVKFELTQDKCNVLDNYNLGQNVKVQFNLRGRKHNNNYYNTLQAWKIEQA